MPAPHQYGHEPYHPCDASCLREDVLKLHADRLDRLEQMLEMLLTKNGMVSPPKVQPPPTPTRIDD